MTTSFSNRYPWHKDSDSVSDADADNDSLPSVAQAVADAYHAGLSIGLLQEDIAFIAGIRAQVQLTGEPNLDESLLRSIYVTVNELLNGDPESMSLRCTRAIARLKNQSILVRVDFGGVLTSSEFALSSLGFDIANWVSRESTLTTQSLELLLTRIRSELSRVLEAARQGGDKTHWEKQVALPLQVIVSALVDHIESRARGLDQQHGGLQRDITSLFNRMWVEAADICNGMLVTVMKTLRELNAVLNEHLESLTRQLSELEDLADNRPEILPTLDRLRNQLQGIHTWCVKRFDEWHNYYSEVHQWIRRASKLDPENRVRDRIRDCIRHYADRPFGLVTTNPVPFLHFRGVIKPDEAQQIPVPASALASRVVHDVGPTPEHDLNLVIAALLRRLAEEGALDLIPALLDEASHLTDTQWFTLLSRATPVLLAHGVAPPAFTVREWLDMSARLAAQSLPIRAKHPAAALHTDTAAERKGD